MMIAMTTTERHQRRYDHRLRDLVQRNGDVTIAASLGVPRSTARGWLRPAPSVVVSLDVTNLTAAELKQEVLELRRRIKKLTALLRLALALLRASGFALTHDRLPTDAPNSGSCEPSIALARLCHCRRSSDSCDCLRAGSTRGDGCSTRARWTTSRRVRTRHPIDSRRPRSGRSRTW